jgi:quinol-cytochrome oxidoreductase complex cytochrome b subunit
MPWLDTSKVRSARYRPIYKQIFWVFLADCIVLGWVGANPPEGHFKVIGQIATAYYFLHLLILIPLVGKLERPRPQPASISEPVLRGARA